MAVKSVDSKAEIFDTVFVYQGGRQPQYTGKVIENDGDSVLVELEDPYNLRRDLGQKPLYRRFKLSKILSYRVLN